MCGGSGLKKEKSLFIVCVLDLLVVWREEEDQQIVSKQSLLLSRGFLLIPGHPEAAWLIIQQGLESPLIVGTG